MCTSIILYYARANTHAVTTRCSTRMREQLFSNTDSTSEREREKERRDSGFVHSFMREILKTLVDWNNKRAGAY